MYKLILNESEMAAFDFVGNCYDSSGDKMSSLICEGIPETREWMKGKITFDIPEYIAWEMKEIAESEDNFFPLFSKELKSKMIDFLSKIV